jgi:exodeoxyribonuclease V gamma subunit
MASGLHIITSNHLEVLAAGLAGLLGDIPEGDASRPLQPEVVLVQSKGMQRWISMAVARINGICANVEFPFPNAFLERLYGQMLGALPACNPYDPQVLTFRILRLLPRLLHRPEFEPLRIYLSEDRRPLKRYQLARRIADLMDQYAVFRPEMLLAWEADPQRARVFDSPAEAWQAVLWARLAAEIQVPHRSAMQHALIRKLADGNAAVYGMPARLAVFGISHLPPFHLQVLEALARRIPVFLFLMNPCRLYWSDILSDRQMHRRRASDDRDASADEMLYLERGNRLLASLGQLGKHFFDFIHQSEAHVDEAFQDNPDTLLGRIQQDILDLVDRAGAAREPQTPPVQADGSLRVHSCHGPMREVEVLYDQLLDILARDDSLQPRDILVMTPDIGLYAPYIHAVFGAARGQAPSAIPYTVTDQGIVLESPAVQSCVQLLDLAGGRLEASRVMALLECPAVHRRFGLCGADLPLVEQWIRDAAICWGWDGTHRRGHHLPGFSENTWRSGLDRLVLGYALSGDDTRLFAGVLPYDGIGAGEDRVLGRFVVFAETLHDAITDLASRDTLEGWHRRLRELLERFFEADAQTTRELQGVRAAIDQLKQVGGGDEGVGFEVVRQYIKDALGRTTFDSGFMAGGVTFCAMLPMRSIPAKTICLLGMNHDAFPRQHHEPGFNLIALAPRKGDRSRRSDDRYLFLETLVSARHTLYLSYVGQDIQDNTPIPPSVVVDELVEYVNEAFGVAPDQLVTRHPLHGFSPAYFDGSHPLLFSYSEENKTAAGQLAAGGVQAPFFDQALAPPPEDWRQCGLGQLAAFFAHPTRHLMEQRLGVYLRESTDAIDDRERFGLAPLDRYEINQQLLKALLDGVPSQAAYATARAAGVLPHGTVGRVLHQQLDGEVKQFIRTLKAHLPEDRPRNAHVHIDLPPFALHGTIDQVYPEARIVLRMANTRPQDLLGTFIHHAAMLAATDRGDLPGTSILLCKDAVWQWGAMASQAAEAVLRIYLDHYWRGMQAPLPFFCRSSYEYAHQHLVKQRPKKAALAAAFKKWSGNDFAPGESSDPYLKRCFDGRNPLTPEFEGTTLAVFEPLLRTSRQIPRSVDGQP